MSASEAPKPVARLNFDEAVAIVERAHIGRKPDNKAAKQRAAQDAIKAGFTTRAEPVKVDGRTRRASKTTLTALLALKTTPENVAAFKKAAADYQTHSDFMSHLLALHRKTTE